MKMLASSHCWVVATGHYLVTATHTYCDWYLSTHHIAVHPDIILHSMTHEQVKVILTTAAWLFLINNTHDKLCRFKLYWFQVKIATEIANFGKVFVNTVGLLPGPPSYQSYTAEVLLSAVSLSWSLTLIFIRVRTWSQTLFSSHRSWNVASNNTSKTCFEVEIKDQEKDNAREIDCT